MSIVSLVLPAYADRNLKRRVELAKIESRVFPIPGGGTFDFGFALNSQMAVEMGRSDYFFALYNLSPEELGFTPDGLSLVVPPTDRYGNEVQQCILDKRQVRLSGAVTSFEMVSSNSISIGYSPAGDSSWGIGGELEAEKAKLYMNVLAWHSPDFVTTSVVGGANGDHTAKMRRTKFDVSWGNFTVSPSFYKRTDLSKVTQEATKKALNDIKQQLDSNEALAWKSVVTKVDEPTITIAAGSLDGVKVGDKFRIENMRHAWRGTPCRSRYEGVEVDDAAIVEIIQVRGTEADAIPIERMGDGIYVGDKVSIESLISGR